MTEKNQRMRQVLKDIEIIAVGAINNQPADDTACEIHLNGALRNVVNRLKEEGIVYAEGK